MNVFLTSSAVSGGLLLHASMNLRYSFKTSLCSWLRLIIINSILVCYAITCFLSFLNFVYSRFLRGACYALILTTFTYICRLPEMAEGADPTDTMESLMNLARQNGSGVGTATSRESGQLLQSTSPSPAPMSELEVDMFTKIVASGLTFKSQQRGEPELSQKQKFEALGSLLHQKPGAFLMRFGKLLNERNLCWFDHLSHTDFEVDFRVKELRKNLAMSSRSRDNVVKNRRFQYLQELVDNGSYFSEEEMRDRNPILYEHYIGQYLSEEEKQLLDGGSSSDMTLSGMIMKKMELDRRSELLSRQQDLEAGQVVESDSSTSSEEEDELEEEEEEEKDEDTEHNRGMKLSVDPLEAGREKQMLREEFLKAMQLRFLSGEERDFDYSKVDSDEQYDSIEASQRDKEDDYFDKEESAFLTEESQPNDTTGMELETAEMESETEDYMTYEPPS